MQDGVDIEQELNQNKECRHPYLPLEPDEHDVRREQNHCPEVDGFSRFNLSIECPQVSLPAGEVDGRVEMAEWSIPQNLAKAMDSQPVIRGARHLPGANRSERPGYPEHEQWLSDLGQPHEKEHQQQAKPRCRGADGILKHEEADAEADGGCDQCDGAAESLHNVYSRRLTLKLRHTGLMTPSALPAAIC